MHNIQAAILPPSVTNELLRQSQYYEVSPEEFMILALLMLFMEDSDNIELGLRTLRKDLKAMQRRDEIVETIKSKVLQEIEKLENKVNDNDKT